MIRGYAEAVSTKRTPQSEAVPGKTQVQNAAGGFGFAVDDWTRLDRWLVLGSDAPTYYADARALTKENAAAVQRCIDADGLRTVARIVEISVAGRAPKNDPAIFAMAMCMKLGGEGTRKAAQAAVPKVCRIGTHIFALAESVKALGGWGRGTRRAFASWYTGQEKGDLAYQLVKYQNRNGWTHRDVLRKCHAAPSDLLFYAAKGWPDIGAEPHPDAAMKIVWAFERAKKAASAAEIIGLVREYGLPRECIPTEHLNSQDVWAALLDNRGKGMPLTAMVRNLAKMTAVGLLSAGSDAVGQVEEALSDVDRIKKARLHPMAILLALKTYAQGHGEKGKLTWSPVPRVVNALDAAFYSSFAAVEPTGKRWLLALDISGSMVSPVGGSSLSCREASAALALVTAATEKEHSIIGFTSGNGTRQPTVNGRIYGQNGGVMPLDITPRRRLDDVCNYTARLAFGQTDCALPMLYALGTNLAVDVFCVLTDNETWAGGIHPYQALNAYRQKTGIAAKMIVVGMTSTGISIADPDDAGMLDVVGFDTAVPAVMADFARGV